MIKTNPFIQVLSFLLLKNRKEEQVELDTNGQMRQSPCRTIKLKHRGRIVISIE